MSTAADPTATFLAAIQASNLLSPAQFNELAGWAATTRPDPKSLAKELHGRGWLTPYQIREIAGGRGRELMLDRYILLDLLGEGGMGRVFKAHDTKLGRDVAVKIIRKERLQHPAAAGRFKAEMEALGKMSHPNVVTAFDSDHVGDTHYVVMEYIDGTDLTKMVRDRGPLPVAEACEAIRQAALGLHHAHEQGMVHRDIKPSNILVGRNGRQVKLVDLGLARLQEPAGGEGANRLTQEGFVIGTPDFLAPEQARDPGSVDIRADIYALGATLYYILTAQVPYEGANPTEKLLKHCTDPPPSLLARRPDILPQIEQIIHWAMAKRPEDRPQTPLQLALALQPFCPPPTSGTHLMPGSGTEPFPGTMPHPAATFQPQQPAAYAPQPAAYAPQPAGYAPQPAFAPAAEEMPFEEPEPQEEVFRVRRRNDQDPIRERAKTGGVPWTIIGIVFGVLFVGAVITYALYEGGMFKDPPPPKAEEERPAPDKEFTNSRGIKMLKIPAGTFMMGSPDDEPGRNEDEGPVHEVTIGGPFFMSEMEVTHAQFNGVMGTNNRATNNTRLLGKNSKNISVSPADSVRYADAVEFCKRLTAQENADKKDWARPDKWEYRLPTEAEWEYACRAGTSSPYAIGPEPRRTLLQRNPDKLLARYFAVEDFEAAGVNPLKVDREFRKEARTDIPSLVGSFKTPNAWGLHDMHGNVAEWCSDEYGPYSADPQTNPKGPESGTGHVIRGGSFRDRADRCRSAARGQAQASDELPTIGFRIVFAPVPGK